MKCLLVKIDKDRFSNVFFHPFLSLKDAEKLTHLPRGLVSQKLPGISASVPLLTHLWSNSPCSGTRSESRWRHWSVEVVDWSVLANFVALDLIFCFRSKSYQEFLLPVRTSEMSSPFASPQPVLCDCQNHPVSRFGGKFQLSNFSEADLFNIFTFSRKTPIPFIWNHILSFSLIFVQHCRPSERMWTRNSTCQVPWNVSWINPCQEWVHQFILHVELLVWNLWIHVTTFLFILLYCLYLHMLLYSRIALSLSKSQALVYPCQIAWWICEYLFLDAHHVVEFWKICWSPTSAIFMGIFVGILDFDTSP